ncbi:pseudouridine synthase [Parvimonas sp. G1425]|uniref:pseudouridine synthase n=1 Tax=Parvimonas sp. G1425 TaxID=3387694 RepID=UPI0039E519B7
MRINKFIANSGYCSRRNADLLLEQKKVLVNGKIATKGIDISETDEILIDGKKIRLEEAKKYYLLNKPVGYSSTAKAQFQEKIVLDLIDSKERIYPVGRLDKDSFGLLLLTNDGDLAFKLTHPSHNVEKEYIVKVDKTLKESDLKKLSSGIMLEGRFTREARFEIFDFKNNIVKVFLKEGRNRQIRKMFKTLGYNVISLERVAFGKIKLGKLKLGSYRELCKEEIEYLRSL